MSETQKVQPMASTPTSATKSKVKRSRAASAPRPAFIVMQLNDENGQPMHFDKKRVQIIAVERNAEKVMELTEEGKHPQAFYLRVVVPAGSRAGSPNKPKEATPAAA